ncbi:hypothetical protein [Methylobacterium sp. WSM2598]|uniref:hypothetical protein n=1 Tax=Methylobacterium sp. WSM2598 TaxID=398261 RepID=UPI0003754B8A|nr:hypothetical protein [Methylobacterium sp. WSM2598]
MNARPLLVLLLILAAALYGVRVSGEGYRQRMADEAERQYRAKQRAACERGDIGVVGPANPCLAMPRR